jgi:GMP reductase
MIIENDVKLDFCDVLLAPKWSSLDSRNDADLNLTRTFTMRWSGNKLTTIPIIASNMDHTGTLEMAKVMNTAFHKFYEPDEIKENLMPVYNRNLNWFTVGQGANADLLLRFLDERFSYRSDWDSGMRICIDVANGHTKKFIDHVAQVRHDFPKATIMAGNVASSAVTQALILAGADIVKVGIGSGSVCTTRKMTGVGYPQLSAIIECADVAHGLGAQICSDGGCTVPGDVCKAFAAGADFVMLGGMLAGHDECHGEKMYQENLDDPMEPKCYGMKFRGMSSKEAQLDHYGSLKEYRASEGKEVIVNYRGAAQDTYNEILGGIRSCMTYIGATNLKDIPKCATFIKVNRQLNGVFS